MVGQTAGKYQILDRIGRGGMGTVYRALDTTLERVVAIKVLNADLNDPEVGRRFRAEAIAVARLNHPGIARIYELFEHQGQWLMVMECLRGETMERMISRLGPLSATRAADLCLQALEALAHAHQHGVVHRDLKPANLMVTDGGLKIMDFGIARVVGAEQLTSAGFMLGTPAFMSPEQVAGRSVDARTDLFAVGVVLHHLVTAKLPFRGDTPMAMAQARLTDPPTPVGEQRASVPAWLGAVIARALQREPDARFQTAEEFATALRVALDEGPGVLASSPDVPAHLAETIAPGSLRAVSQNPPIASAAVDEAVQDSRGVAGVNRRWLVPAGVFALAVAVSGWWWLAPGPTGPPERSEGRAREGRGAEVPPEVSAPAARGNAVPRAEEVARAPGPADEGPRGGSGTVGPPGASASGARGGAVPRIEEDKTGASARPKPAPTPPRAQDEPVSFLDVKHLVVADRSASDRDAVLRLGGGRVAVLTDSGDSLGSLRYAEMLASTYVRGRQPKWDARYASPPANLDLPGGLFGIRTTRHWLVVQSRASYLLLSLPESRLAEILDALGTRSGKPVTRAPQ